MAIAKNNLEPNVCRRGIRWTGEVVGGLIAGFGLGIWTLAFALSHKWISNDWGLIPVGIAFFAAGGFVIRYSQRRLDRGRRAGSK